MSATITQFETLNIECDTNDCRGAFKQSGRYRAELLTLASEAGWHAYKRADLNGSDYGPVQYACPTCSKGALR